MTDKINNARYAIPYTGIPRNCQQCNKDVLEHQILHHVLHGRCKFCVVQMRPMKREIKDTTLKAFKCAVLNVNQEDGRTCAHCLKIFCDSYQRKVHEQAIHEKISCHKCQDCEKVFSNSTSLKYHQDKHTQSEKIICDICDKSFVSLNGLNLHKEIVHSSEEVPKSKFICEKCSKPYRSLSSLARHKRTVHYMSNVNKDFANCFKAITDFKCDQCEKNFSRKDQLKRHKQTIHENSFQLECPSCEKIFKRKDKLTKHMKAEHEGDQD